MYKDYAEVIWNERYKVQGEVEGLDVCDYPLSRNLVMFTITILSEVIINFVETGEKKDYIFTLKDMNITRI